MKREEELKIIERILNGETALYNQLVNLHAPRILSVVRGVVSGREDAEEVAQDVFVKAYFSLKSFRGECSFSTWLFRIAFNMSVSKARQRRTEHVPMEKSASVPDTSAESREESMDKENRFRILYKAIDELEPSDRFLILSFYNHEKSIKEICDICGMTESNVKVRLHRIKKRLGVMLGDKMEVCYG